MDNLRWNQIKLPKSVFKGEDGRYYKKCHKCGILQSYLRRNYAVESFNKKKMCKKCSNRITDNCHRGLYNDTIRISWFNKFKVNAELRNYSWSIDIEYIYDLYLKQNGKCNLSGIDISCAKVGGKHTMSIDRIDNNLGYEKGNIQLVHKDINMIKSYYNNDYFIEICNLVHNHNKEKW